MGILSIRDNNISRTQSGIGKTSPLVLKEIEIIKKKEINGEHSNITEKTVPEETIFPDTYQERNTESMLTAATNPSYWQSQMGVLDQYSIPMYQFGMYDMSQNMPPQLSSDMQIQDMLMAQASYGNVPGQYPNMGYFNDANYVQEQFNSDANMLPQMYNSDFRQQDFQNQYCYGPQIGYGFSHENLYTEDQEKIEQNLRYKHEPEQNQISQETTQNVNQAPCSLQNPKIIDENPQLNEQETQSLLKEIMSDKDQLSGSNFIPENETEDDPMDGTSQDYTFKREIVENIHGHSSSDEAEPSQEFQPSSIKLKVLKGNKKGRCKFREFKLYDIRHIWPQSSSEKKSSERENNAQNLVYKNIIDAEMDDDVQSDDDIIKCAQANIVSLDRAIKEYVAFCKVYPVRNQRQKVERNKINKYIRNLRYNYKKQTRPIRRMD
ncbi:unnamed protein product [Moneuplotes crassus]|uniref:Uncharacterized protein n=1 Tax=Euplotes crassus TaxID=5936 RepID=A0AAD1XRK6_EUPCR|nr:unnamed protein product [Moneuplotes crassus]